MPQIQSPPPPPRPSHQPHRGSLIIVLGIIALVVCAPVGIAAWIMGNNDLREIRAGRMDPEGEGLTNAGRILGIVATVLMLIPLVIIALAFAFMAIAGGAAAVSQG